MKTKLLTSIALLGLSMGTAQAVTLNYSGSHTFDGQVDYFYFDNNSAGNVSLWTDTLQDGFDSAGSLFKKNDINGSYEWSGIAIGNGPESAFDPVLGYNTTGVNDFGVAIKNGYVQNSQTDLGVSDTGATRFLDAGSYLFAVSGFQHIPVAQFQSDTSKTIDDGFVDLKTVFNLNNPEWEWSTWTYNTGGAPSPYEVYINGDVSAAVSSVPVPAAVWLFATAIAGLGVMRKNKQNI